MPKGSLFFELFRFY